MLTRADGLGPANQHAAVVSTGGDGRDLAITESEVVREEETHGHFPIAVWPGTRRSRPDGDSLRSSGQPPGPGLAGARLPDGASSRS